MRHVQVAASVDFLSVWATEQAQIASRNAGLEEDSTDCHRPGIGSGRPGDVVSEINRMKVDGVSVKAIMLLVSETGTLNLFEKTFVKIRTMRIPPNGAR